MTLSINTTNLDEITFMLLDSKKKVIAEKITKIVHHENDTILKLLEQFLKKQKNPKLTAIEVQAGAGSYTGIRVGTSIAQALSLAWNIPLKIKK